MNNQQLITQIESKIQEAQTLITNYKNQLASHENALLNLIQQLTQIKQNIQQKNQIK